MPWRHRPSGLISEHRPNRLRLEDGFTRTNEEISDELLAASGWWWDSYVAPIEEISEPQWESTTTNSQEIL